METPLYTGVKNSTASLTTASSQVLNQMPNNIHRTQFIITNLSATTVTVTKGTVPAVANQGIILSQNQSYYESDSGGFNCWQGAVQAVASAASTVSIVEGFENRE